MTSHLSWETLSDLADGRLAPAARQAAQLHLAECPDCGSARDALERVTAAAAALPHDEAPPSELWDSIAASIGTSIGASVEGRSQRQPPRRSLAFSPRTLAAAALVLMAASSAVTAWLLRRESGAPVAATPPAAARGDGARALPVAFSATERAYLADVSQLQALFAAERRRLAPATIAVVERALADVDAAIAEARAALLADPANQAIAEVLVTNYRQKVELLRRAAESSTDL